MSTTTSSTTTTTTTLPPYCDDDDLSSYRPNIMDYGVPTWSAQRLKATKIVNRDIEAEWYRKASKERSVDFKVTGFQPGLMLARYEQLEDLTCYKAFELIYEYLSKDVDGDVFRTLADRYHKSYEKELKRVILTGIDYDWDASGGIDSTEKYEMVAPRTLRRV